MGDFQLRDSACAGILIRVSSTFMDSLDQKSLSKCRTLLAEESTVGYYILLDVVSQQQSGFWNFFLAQWLFNANKLSISKSVVHLTLASRLLGTSNYKYLPSSRLWGGQKTGTSRGESPRALVFGNRYSSPLLWHQESFEDLEGANILNIVYFHDNNHLSQ